MGESNGFYAAAVVGRRRKLKIAQCKGLKSDISKTFTSQIAVLTIEKAF